MIVGNRVKITAGPFVFIARMQTAKAPATCAMFAGLLPFRNRVIHSRWSGEAVWIPLGEMATGLAFENHTSHSSRGDLLFYPGGFSETEILFVYGSSRFAKSKRMTQCGSEIWMRRLGRAPLGEL